MRTRRQLRAATLYLGYLGQRNPTTKTSVRVSVFAVSNAILPARWYDTTWDPNGDVPIPGWNWRDAGVEARLQRVGGFTVRLNQKQGMWTRSQYIPVALNVTWLNQFQSAQVWVCSFLLYLNEGVVYINIYASDTQSLKTQ